MKQFDYESIFFLLFSKIFWFVCQFYLEIAWIMAGYTLFIWIKPCFVKFYLRSKNGKQIMHVLLAYTCAYDGALSTKQVDGLPPLHCKYLHYNYSGNWDTRKKWTLYKYLPYTLQCRSVDTTINHCKSVLHLFHCTWSSN